MVLNMNFVFVLVAKFYYTVFENYLLGKASVMINEKLSVHCKTRHDQLMMRGQHLRVSALNIL